MTLRRSHSATPARTSPTTADDPADDLDGGAEIGDAQGLEQDRAARQHDPDQHQCDRDAREGSPGRFGRELEVDRHLVGEDRLQLMDRAVEGPQSLDTAAQHTDRVGRRMGGGQRLDLDVDLDRLLVALVALGGGVALGGDPFGLARLVEHAPSLGEDPVGLGPAIARGGHRVAIPFELGQRELALLERHLRLLDGLFGDLELARVAVTAGVQVVERPVELPACPARAAVGAADRGLETVAQRALVARQVAQLEMADRGSRPEEALGRDPGQFGHDLVGEVRVGDRLALVVEADGPLVPGEGLLERADLLAVLVVLLELDGDDRAGLRWRSPGPEGLDLCRGARRSAGQGELEGSLDRRLAGLVGTTDDGHARGEVDVELAIAPEVLPGQLADPHRETS